MKSIIENAVKMAFSVISSLTLPTTYVVVKKNGFEVDESETHSLDVIIAEDETDDPSYGNSGLTKRHDLEIMFETQKLPVEAKHGDKVILDGKTFEIEDPIEFDPIKVTTTLSMRRVS